MHCLDKRRGGPLKSCSRGREEGRAWPTCPQERLASHTVTGVWKFFGTAKVVPFCKDLDLHEGHLKHSWDKCQRGHKTYRLKQNGYLWDAKDLGNGPKSESSQKWLGEGAKGLLDPVSKRPLALVWNGVAPVQKRVWVVQKTLGRPLLPGPKRVKKTFCTLP